MGAERNKIMNFQEAILKAYATCEWAMPTGKPLRAISWREGIGQQHDRWINFAHVYGNPGHPAPDACIPSPDDIAGDWEVVTKEQLERQVDPFPVR
jgi:hypothetical protein